MAGTRILGSIKDHIEEKYVEGKPHPSPLSLETPPVGMANNYLFLYYWFSRITGCHYSGASSTGVFTCPTLKSTS
jgi:hypothetical protein